MSTATLVPSANHIASSGTIAYTNGSANYTVMSDANDSSYMTETGIGSYALLPIYGSVPGDIGTVTAISITIRTAHQIKGDVSDIAYLQLFKSDGTTAISSQITVTPGSITTSIANYTFYPTVTLSGQSDWNNVHLKITSDGGTAACYIYEASVAITYTASNAYYYSGSNGVSFNNGIISFKIIAGLLTITFSNPNLNYNFSIEAFKSRTTLQAHMKIY